MSWGIEGGGEGGRGGGKGGGVILGKPENK
jgi:hypothetical protein